MKKLKFSLLIVAVINKTYKKFIRTLKLLLEIVRYESVYTDLGRWRQGGFQMPSPSFVKREVLLRTVIKDSTIIETGTHTGDTSALLLRVAKDVISIEADEILFLKALKRFRGVKKIQIIKGDSELIFPSLIPSLSGNISFWLDGHYSGKGTFLGEKETPIIAELQSIHDNLSNFKKICVLVDDIRLFSSEISRTSSYPSLNYLVEWANKNRLYWHIEHDIFIAKNF